LCFPNAGGLGESFSSWAKHLPEGIELWSVSYPRSQNISGEALIASLVATVGHETSVPYAFFGHSFGVSLAWRVTVELNSRGATLPTALFLSAWPGPAAWRTPPELSAVSDARQMIADISGGKMSPEAVPKALVEAFIADARMGRSLPAPDQTRLPVPIAAFLGISDPVVDRASIEGWRDVTSLNFSLEMFPGDHFYLFDDDSIRRHLVECILKHVSNGIDIDSTDMITHGA
jgi:surfactin synthase thioesterase subunit